MEQTINQIFGWGLTALVVLGIGTILLVILWPRLKMKKILKKAESLGFRKLDPRGPEIEDLRRSSAAGLLSCGKDCKIRAAWEIPGGSRFAVTTVQKYVVPVSGGKTNKTQVTTVFVVVSASRHDDVYTIQANPFNNAVGGFILGLVEKKTGALRPSEDILDPRFSKAFLARGPGVPKDRRDFFENPPHIPPRLQEFFVSTMEESNPLPDLKKVLGMDGSLRVMPEGFALSMATNYYPKNLEDIRRLLELLDRIDQILQS